MTTYALCVCIGCVTLVASAGLSLASTSSQGDGSWVTCIYDGKEHSYRPEREACCNGHILQRSPNLEETCCNGHLFDSSTGRCCGDQKWIDRQTHYCCGGRVYPLSEHGECCNNQWIDRSTQTCCRGHVVEGTGTCCGNSDVYDDKTEHCCIGPGNVGNVTVVGSEAVSDGFLECCGTETIDTRSDLCCQGNPVEQKSSFTECCGPETYDTHTQVCCEWIQVCCEWMTEYRISPLEDGKVDCCHLTPYNQDNDKCCERVITPNIGAGGKCCRAVAYNPLQSSCCLPGPVALSIPEIPGVQDCCKGVSYLKTRQVCCGGALHDLESGKACCGGDMFDVKSQVCCGNQIMEKSSASTECCGDSATYDPEQQTCCNGQVFDEPHWSCCRTWRNQYQAFNPELSKCCEREMPFKVPRRGRIGSVQPIDAECCGAHALAEDELCNNCTQTPVTKQSLTDNAVCYNCPSQQRNENLRSSIPQTYNEEKQKCVGGKIYRLQRGRRTCGSNKLAYDKDTQLCCWGNIHMKYYQAEKPYQQMCCGRDAFVPEWHTCHNDRVNRYIPDRNASYCRDNPYNNYTDICDENNGFIRPIKEMELGLKACTNFEAERGYHAYDPTKQECCGHELIGSGYTCCHGKPFSTPGTAVGEGQCCGSKGGFNPGTHICCAGVPHLLTSPGLECCGRQLYDPASPAQICCDDMLQSTDDGKTVCTDGVAHRPTDTVCQGRVYQGGNGECCGPVLMDSNNQICCQDKFLYERDTHGDTCCGRIAYYSRNQTKKCCMDSLFHDAQHLECCDSQIMDPLTQTCRTVGDTSYSFPKTYFSSEWEMVLGHTVCNGLVYPFLGECCENQIIASGEKDKICCGGRKTSHSFGEQAMCCGGEVLDKERYTCCGGKPLDKQSTWRTCCNGEVVGRLQCQAAKPRLPSDLSQPSCGGQEYNATMMSCCGEQIYNPQEYSCSNDILRPLCGGATFDNTSLICCADATHDASATGCCNGQPYDLRKQTCCAEMLYRVKNGSCCGLLADKAYNRNRYLCCDNNLQRMKKGRTECCGTSAYNPEADTCCDQSLTRGTRRGSCCGNRAFEPANKICCQETATLSRRRDDSEDISEDCCAPGFLYNKDSGTCQQQACKLCKNLKSTEGWQNHTDKPTLIRGTASNLTTTPSHHVLHLTRVSHLNHNKRESGLDSRELDVIIAGHCRRCMGGIRLGKAYVAMSEAEVVTEGVDSARLTLRTTDFLVRARGNLGMKIKYRLCRLG